jgi:hypothetical protein
MKIEIHEYFFRKNAKALCFDVLIEKKVITTSPKKDQYRAIQLNPKPRLGEYLAKTPGSHVRPLLRLS